MQQLLKEKCIVDEKLFASFLNRLFNTLNWTITEFSVVIKEMEELTERGCPVRIVALPMSPDGLRVCSACNQLEFSAYFYCTSFGVEWYGTP
jgi:hypothetical protein